MCLHGFYIPLLAERDTLRLVPTFLFRAIAKPILSQLVKARARQRSLIDFLAPVIHPDSICPISPLYIKRSLATSRTRRSFLDLIWDVPVYRIVQVQSGRAGESQLPHLPHQGGC